MPSGLVCGFELLPGSGVCRVMQLCRQRARSVSLRQPHEFVMKTAALWCIALAHRTSSESSLACACPARGCAQIRDLEALQVLIGTHGMTEPRQASHLICALATDYCARPKNSIRVCAQPHRSHPACLSTWSVPPGTESSTRGPNGRPEPPAGPASAAGPCPWPRTAGPERQAVSNPKPDTKPCCSSA
jgi:hypothetical protein